MTTTSAPHRPAARTAPTLLRTALGHVLRRRRSALGLRIADVAARANLSVAYVSEVERGRKEPSSEVVAALCDALDLSLSGVLRDVGDRLESEQAERERRERRTLRLTSAGRHLYVVGRDEPGVVVGPATRSGYDAELLAA
jgi:transcriptional regulator with XRE-family HTH domain